MVSSPVGDLCGRWAVVTGGSKGIGLGIAEALVNHGANVAIVARSADDLAVAKEQLQKLGGDGQEVLSGVADFGDPGDIDRYFEKLRDQIGHLDVFVANAGTGGLTSFLDLQLTEWDRIVNTNLRGTFVACQAAARMMLEHPNRGQCILVISSIRSHGYRPGTLPYACSKAALNQFVRGTAYELSSPGIRVNALSPGMTVTPLMLKGTPNVEEIAAQTIPMGRAGQPMDMAEAAVFLCGPHAAFITGANLVVDGGESLR